MVGLRYASDVVFELRDGVVYGHSLLLSVRSDYFRKLLSWGTPKVHVADASVASFTALLRYVYTGSCTLAMSSDKRLSTALPTHACTHGSFAKSPLAPVPLCIDSDVHLSSLSGRVPETRTAPAQHQVEAARLDSIMDKSSAEEGRRGSRQVDVLLSRAEVMEWRKFAFDTQCTTPALCHPKDPCPLDASAVLELRLLARRYMLPELAEGTAAALVRVLEPSEAVSLLLIAQQAAQISAAYSGSHHDIALPITEAPHQ